MSVRLTVTAPPTQGLIPQPVSILGKTDLGIEQIGVIAPGTEMWGGRLRVVDVRGSGATSIVYEAFDTQRGAVVALKTFSRVGPSGVYALKNEFRTLVEVRHPNLVKLHELFAEDSAWYFTMELVDGEPLNRWVRPGGVLDEGRLRAALSQLVDAVEAIHANGKLHRDLKPSNILVTPAGRVVVLDFGLAAAQCDDSEIRFALDGVCGTPAYMSPEQAAGQPASSASDYYALGVIMFEALTGRLPIEGRAEEILIAKQRDRAPPVLGVMSEAPPDLAACCDLLLERAPSARPASALLRQKLSLSTRPSSWITPDYSAHLIDVPPSVRLVGRDDELSVLRRAFAYARDGQTVACLVSGDSGQGKSTLVRCFIDELRGETDAVVLAARCFERENVPYRGFDGIIDALAQFLHRLPHEIAAALLPRNVAALADIFPVLARVEAVAWAPTKSGQSTTAHERESRALAAFGELLSRVRERFPVVLFIDDLQWIDADSVALLRHFLGAPERESVQIVACYRVGEFGSNPLLQQALHILRTSRSLAVSEIELAPLPPSIAARLARELLGGNVDDTLPVRIASESAGNPFFIGELARFARSTSGANALRLSVVDAVDARVAQLPETARRLLEVIAVNATRTTVAFAGAVLRIGAHVRDVAELLCQASLARSEPGCDGQEIECYHDRVRESVMRGLDAATIAEIHRRLAEALERLSQPDALALTVHWEAAGEPQRAARCAAFAANEALAVLAFERAVTLCRKALEIGTLMPEERRRLQIILAEAYEALGRGAVSAEAYLAAAQGAEPLVALDLRRRAAERLIMCGAFDQGSALIGEVLCELGMPIPSTSGRALVSFLWQRTRVRMGRLHYVERGESKIDRRTLARIDALWSCAMGLAMTDNVLGVVFQTRHLRLALNTGELTRLARALILEYGYVSRFGAGTKARTDHLYTLAHRLCERLSDPYLLGLLATMRSNAAYMQGNLLEADANGAAAVALLEGVGRDALFHQANALFFLSNARVALGRLGAIRNSLPARIADAKRRGDVYTRILLTTLWQRVALYLVDDRLEESRCEGRELRAAYTSSGYHLAHTFMTVAEAVDETYAGQYELAYCLIERDWPVMVRSYALRIASLHATLLFSRVGATLGVARARSDAERKVLIVRSNLYARKLHSLAVDWPNSRVLAALADAAIYFAEHNADKAADALAAAIAHADRLNETLFAAAARRRLGQLLGGSEGESLVAQSTVVMQAEEIVNMERISEVFAPCCMFARC